jgi:hypothetical protein
VSVVQADINRIAPELAALSAPDFAGFLSDAQLELDATVWGLMLDLGTKYLVAHKMAIAHPELTSPHPVQSEQVGDIRRSFAVSAPRDPDAYDQTKYGREFKRLRRTLGTHVQVL